MVRQACAGVVVLSLSACASTLPYGQPVSTEQHVFSTNFSVGAEKSCPVGDVMVRVKDYYTLTTSKTAWTTEVPVLIHLVLGKAQLPPGVYPVVSRKQMENEQFDVIQPPFGGALLVDQSGRIRKEMNGLENIGYDVTV